MADAPYYVETVTGPVYVDPSLPDWVNQQNIENAGGLVEPTATPQPIPPPAPGGGGQPGDTAPNVNQGYYVQTPTGPVYIDPNLPQWVNDLNVQNAGGLLPAGGGAGAAPPPPSGTVAPPTGRGGQNVPPGTQPVTPPGPRQPPAYEVGPPPSQQLAGTRLEAEVRVPPGGLPLTADWPGIARSFADAIHAMPDRLPPPGVVTHELTGDFEATIAGFGLGDANPWPALKKLWDLLLRMNQLTADPATYNPGQSPETGLPPLVSTEAVVSLAMNSDPAAMVAHAVSDEARHALLGLQGKYEDLFRGFHGVLMDILTEGAPNDPAAAENRLARSLELALGFGASAHGIAEGLELISPLKNVGFGQLAGFVAEFGGFGPLIEAFYFALFRAAIRRPLESSYNQRWPTEELGTLDVMRLAREHEYDYSEPLGALRMPSDFAHDVAVHGYDVDKAERIWAHNATTPRLYDVVRMADVLLNTGPPPAEITPLLVRVGTDPSDELWWLDYQLRQNGFASWTIPLYKRALTHRATAADRNRQLTELTDYLVAGYMDDSAYETAARNLDIREEQIQFNITTAKLTRTRTYFNGLTTQWEDAFVKEQISADELRSNLAVFTHDPVELDFKLAVTQMKHDIKTRAHLDTAHEQSVGALQRAYIAAWKRQYEAGLLDDTTFTNNVVALGFTQDYAVAALYDARTTRDVSASKTRNSALDNEHARVVEALAQAYEAQFEQGILDHDQLITQFIGAGMQQDLARARGFRAWARQVKQAADELKRQQQQAARQEDSANRVQVRREEEQQQQHYDEIAHAYLETLIALHTDKVLSTQQLYLALLDAGWEPNLARQIAAREAARRHEGAWGPGPDDLGGPVPDPAVSPA